MDVSEWLRQQIEEASPDLLATMVQDFAEALTGAQRRRRFAALARE
jgi:hypothetical protein